MTLFQSDLLTLFQILRTSHASAYQQQINQFLSTQAQRLEAASLLDRQKRDSETSRKRQLAPSSSSSSLPSATVPSSSALPFEIPSTTKRRKLNPGVDLIRAFGAANLDLNANLAATPVAAGFPLEVVVDLLVKTFEGTPEAVLKRAMEMVKMQLPPSELNPSRGEFEQKVVVQEAAVVPPPSQQQVPVEMDMERGEEFGREMKMDPLKLDLGEEELNIKAEVPPEPIVSILFNLFSVLRMLAECEVDV